MASTELSTRLEKRAKLLNLREIIQRERGRGFWEGRRWQGL